MHFFLLQEKKRQNAAHPRLKQMPRLGLLCYKPGLKKLHSPLSPFLLLFFNHDLFHLPWSLWTAHSDVWFFFFFFIFISSANVTSPQNIKLIKKKKQPNKKKIFSQVNSHDFLCGYISKNDGYTCWVVLLLTLVDDNGAELASREENCDDAAMASTEDESGPALSLSL